MRIIITPYEVLDILLRLLLKQKRDLGHSKAIKVKKQVCCCSHPDVLPTVSTTSFNDVTSNNTF